MHHRCKVLLLSVLAFATAHAVQGIKDLQLAGTANQLNAGAVLTLKGTSQLVGEAASTVDLSASTVTLPAAFATDAEVTAALALKANLASPTFTGTPAAPTAAVDTNTTQLATTAFAKKEADDAQAAAIAASQPLDADLTSIAGNASGGFLTRTAANTYTPRTITGTAGQITVTNGDGVSGAPTISLPSTITPSTTFTGSVATNSTSGFIADSSNPKLVLTENGVRTWTLQAASGGLNLQAGSAGTWTIGNNVPIAVSNTTASTSTTTGSATFGGGIGVAGAGWFGGNVNTAGTFGNVSNTSERIGFGTNKVSIFAQNNELIWNGVALLPANDSVRDLGITGTNRWRDLFLGGNITFGTSGSVLNGTTGSIGLTATGTNQAIGFYPSGTGIVSINGSSGNQAQLNLGSTGAAGSAFTISSQAAQTRRIIFQTAGSTRWTIATNNSAESGSNAGSDFVLTASTDAAVVIDNPISIVRAAGGLMTVTRPQSITNTTASTSTTTGALVVSGGAGFAGQVTASALNINPSQANALGLVNAYYNAGTHAAGTVVPNNFSTNGAGDVGGTTAIRPWTFHNYVTGANNVLSTEALRSESYNDLTAGTLSNMYGFQQSGRVRNAGATGNWTGITSGLSLSGAGNVTGNVSMFYASSIGKSSTGDVTGPIYGYYASDVGRASASTVAGFYSSDVTKGSSIAAGFRGVVTAATGKYNLYMDGTAANYLGGVLTVAESITSTHATSGIGYGTGAGGAITQLTSRTTGVTLNKVSGDITLFTAAGSATAASFTVTNSAVAATDTISYSVRSSTNKYHVFTTNIAAGSFEITFQTTGGTASDAPIIHFNVHKGVNN